MPHDTEPWLPAAVTVDARRVDAFVGLEVSVDISNALLAAMRNIAPALGDRVPGVRWVSPLDLHVLLHHLPGVHEEALEAVADSIAERAEALDPFDLAVRGLVLGPDPRSATGLWAGLVDPGGRLDPLIQVVGEVVDALGFDGPPPLAPLHVVVALFPAIDLPALVRSAIETLADEGFGVLHVPHVALFVRDDDGPQQRFRVSRRAHLRHSEVQVPERFAGPRPERTERAEALEERARDQIAEVRDEGDET